ncbi:hypothetical protein [Paenibacillus sp. UNC451MF]|uniref:hypothetical protein n=1 Tax=Paenibacillus sp. UNC451MF TaxID=1449063 RepID=UPI0012DFB688|nr:hypothetical protein [Paenibacillus sp. UNC451MF]
MPSIKEYRSIKIRRSCGFFILSEQILVNSVCQQSVPIADLCVPITAEKRRIDRTCRETQGITGFYSFDLGVVGASIIIVMG